MGTPCLPSTVVREPEEEVVGHPVGHLTRRALGKMLLRVGWLGAEAGRQHHRISSGGLEEDQGQKFRSEAYSGDLELTSGESSWLATMACRLLGHPHPGVTQT